jgi:hypothetical protein
VTLRIPRILRRRVPSPPPEQRRRGWRPAAFSILFVASLLLAIALFPRDDPISSPGAIVEIGINNDGPLYTNLDPIRVVMIPMPGNRTQVTITGQFARDVLFGVTVPHEAGAPSPEASMCTKAASERCRVRTTATSSFYTFDSSNSTTITSPRQGLRFEVPGTALVGYGATENARFAAVTLPRIDLYNSSTPGYGVPSSYVGAPVTIEYHLAHWNRYSWSAGAPSADRLSPDGAIWSEVTDATGAIPLTVATGESPTQSAADEQRLFLAGAFVGLTGAALIAFVQELRPHRPRRRLRSASTHRGQRTRRR